MSMNITALVQFCVSSKIADENVLKLLTKSVANIFWLVYKIIFLSFFFACFYGRYCKK